MSDATAPTPPEQRPPDTAPELPPQSVPPASTSSSAILSSSLGASGTTAEDAVTSIGGTLGGTLSGSSGTSSSGTPKKTERPDSLSELLISRGFVTADQVRAAVAQGKISKANPIKIMLDEGSLKHEDYDTLRAEMQYRQSQNIRIPGYEVLGFLGAGAMASVFKGKQLSLDRVVAIKVLPQKYSEDPEFVRRFAEEGKIAAKLNHPNIVQAYDEGIAGHQHYFVMEYIDGTTVHDVILKQGAYSEADALRIALLIADALGHAHQVGLIHRDVKPKNIMLTSRGEPKLADMGLAVLSTGAGEDERGKIYGTPAYLAPEQAKPGVVLDNRADLYSFGATLFHMVTGRVPFPASTAVEMIQKHLNEPVESPCRLNKQISSGLSDIIEVCMAKNQDARYGNAEDLIADLQAVQRGEPPIIARRAFTIDALAAIDAPPELSDGSAQLVPLTLEEEAAAFFKEKAKGPKLVMGQPIIFWWAIAGWTMALLMTIIAVFRIK